MNRIKKELPPVYGRITAFLILATVSVALNAQRSNHQAAEHRYVFGVHADPLISWFSTDIDSVSNDGARSGFNFGLTVHRFFGPNYAVSTGINLISSGGRLVSRDTTIFDLSHNKDLILTSVNPGEAIVYKIQYLSIPIGLKLQTNQIGYVTFFTDLGIDPKILISNKVNIPSNNIENQKAPEEVKTFNIAYHVFAGIEYGVGGNTAIVLALGFENNFADLTSDIRGQYEDRVTHRMICLRLGVNF